MSNKPIKIARKEWILTELQQATVNLSISSKPELHDVIGGASLDELALGFDDFFVAASPILKESDTTGFVLLKNIDERLSRMSGLENAELWTERAFFESKEWIDIREQAAIAIEYFGWQNSKAY